MTYLKSDPFVAGSLHCNAVIKEIMGNSQNIFCNVCNSVIGRRKIFEHFSNHFEATMSDLLTEELVRKYLSLGK